MVKGFNLINLALALVQCNRSKQAFVLNMTAWFQWKHFRYIRETVAQSAHKMNQRPSNKSLVEAGSQQADVSIE